MDFHGTALNHGGYLLVNPQMHLFADICLYQDIIRNKGRQTWSNHHNNFSDVDISIDVQTSSHLNRQVLLMSFMISWDAIWSKLFPSKAFVIRNRASGVGSPPRSDLMKLGKVRGRFLVDISWCFFNSLTQRFGSFSGFGHSFDGSLVTKIG